MKINEIFYSLQGEGRFAGHAAVFVRLSGCNLACPFCDTQHQDGREMTDDEIIGEIRKYPARHAVITGGEPGLQLTREFVDRLRHEGYFVQVETNGTLPIPPNVDWVTCSPKTLDIVPERVDEIKLLFHDDGHDEERVRLYEPIEARHRSLQPCDHSMTVHDDDECRLRNAATLASCIAFVKAHPTWSLSLQTHKILGIR